MEIKKTSRVDLQNKKILFFEIGLALALLFTLLAFNWASRSSSITANLADHMQITSDVEEDLPITFQEPPAPQDIAEIQPISEVFVIVDNEIELEKSYNFNAESNAKDVIKLMDYVNKKADLIPEEAVNEVIPVDFMQDPPRFDNGDANSFTRWVMSNIRYPLAAQEANIQGTVYLSFEIGTDGKLGNLKLIRGVDPLLNQEAMRVVASSPLWTPGKQNRKEVRVSYQFPVRFKLQ